MASNMFNFSRHGNQDIYFFPFVSENIIECLLLIVSKHVVIFTCRFTKSEIDKIIVIIIKYLILLFKYSLNKDIFV